MSYMCICMFLMQLICFMSLAPSLFYFIFSCSLLSPYAPSWICFSLLSPTLLVYPSPSTPLPIIPLLSFLLFNSFISFQCFLSGFISRQAGLPWRHLERMLKRPCLPAIQAFVVIPWCFLVSHLPAASCYVFSSLPSASSALPLLLLHPSLLHPSFLPPPFFLSPSFLLPPSFLLSP